MHATLTTFRQKATEKQPTLNPRRVRVLQTLLDELRLRHPRVHLDNEFYRRMQNGTQPLDRADVNTALDDGHLLGVLTIAESAQAFEINSYSVADAMEETKPQPFRRDFLSRARA